MKKIEDAYDHMMRNHEQLARNRVILDEDDTIAMDIGEDEIFPPEICRDIRDLNNGQMLFDFQ